MLTRINHAAYLEIRTSARRPKSAVTEDAASRARMEGRNEPWQASLWPRCEVCLISVEPGAHCQGQRFGVRTCPFAQHDPATGTLTKVGGVISGLTVPATRIVQ